MKKSVKRTKKPAFVKTVAKKVKLSKAQKRRLRKTVNNIAYDTAVNVTTSLTLDVVHGAVDLVANGVYTAVEKVRCLITKEEPKAKAPKCVCGTAVPMHVITLDLGNQEKKCNCENECKDKNPAAETVEETTDAE